jgi:AAA family ATP:ADP antiporter
VNAGTPRPPDRDSSPGGLERFLRLFADVRAGEGATALLLMSNIFLTLAAYYLLKTIREPLILAGKGGSAEVKSYAAAATAACLIVLVPAYSALASRVSRVRLVNGVAMFFIVNLVIFFALGQAGVMIGVPFFIWVGIFNMMIIAQLWAFANDVYTVEQGKRLFAIVGIGASLGAIAGSFFTGQLVRRFGPYPFMIAAATLLLLTIVLTSVVEARERRSRGAGPASGGAAPGSRAPADVAASNAGRIAGKNGFALVLSDRYLLLIASLMVILNLVNTTGEYILGETVKRIAAEQVAAGRAGGLDEQKIIGGFYGGYFTWVNVVSALIQALVVSRVLKYAGVRGALLVLPIIAVSGYTLLAFLPVLSIIRTAKIAENSIDYSLQNTARNALYLPLDRAAKYKAKQANDTFFVRLGDVLSAGLVFAGLHWFGFAPRQFALANACIAGVWVILALVLGARFQQKAGVR